MGPPRAHVLVTGSELVRGSIRDANGAFLAAELTRLGLEPERVTIVGDRPDILAEAVREALKADLCVVSGGLGPTHDDRTVELVAGATGRPLVVIEELVDEIGAVSRRTAERLGRPYTDFEAGVRKQATIPDGAHVVGLAGTAPALLVEHGGDKVVLTLPGPPGELRRLWSRALEHAAVRRVLARAPRREHRLLRLFGPSESAVARALADAGGEGDGVEITICARDLEIHVDLWTAVSPSARADAMGRALRAEFGSQVFATDDRPIEKIVLDLARTRGLRLATAESCTGGLVGARLTAIPGASDVYAGGVVSYADDVKGALLGVSESTLARHGAVSAETAAAMADGARRVVGADVAVSVTGIAGPGGGTDEKPVGLVHIHAVSPDGAAAHDAVFPGSREDVRVRATVTALHLLRRVLSRSAQVPRDFRD